VIGARAAAVALAAAAATVAPTPGGTGPQGRVGQFVVECAWSHSSFDDPIVHPGHSGASHRHDFFGNTTTSAGSTYEQLLAAPTTCQQRLDTAAYWAPSLQAADGPPVEPIAATAYYRVGAGVDPAAVKAYPPDLRMLGGGDTTDGDAGGAGWSCRAGSAREASPPRCAATSGLRLSVVFPDCWDGENVDSLDHRSHVAYGDAGGCPGRHPTPIPQLELVIDYGMVDPDGLTLSSGAVSTAHADFWNAWDQDKLETEVESCLRRQRVCGVSSG
jgi:Domain of unknown function (DUF1996)